MWLFALEAVGQSGREWLAATLKPSLPWLVAGWITGVVVMVLQQLGGWLVLHRLCQLEARPADEPLVQQLQRLAQRFGVHRTLRLIRAPRIDVPSVVGHFKPLKKLLHWQ